MVRQHKSTRFVVVAHCWHRFWHGLGHGISRATRAVGSLDGQRRKFGFSRVVGICDVSFSQEEPMKYFEYKGKHAELCHALEAHKTDDALSHIYAFFRSEENTDSYSIPALTAARELLEDGESQELERIRIRMRANGDKMFITLAQFMWAAHLGGYKDFAAAIAEKLDSELERFVRSIKEYVDEEGAPGVLDSSGFRCNEAIRMMTMYYLDQDDFNTILHCSVENLEMTRLLMPNRPNFIASHLLDAARSYRTVGQTEKCMELCKELLDTYDVDGVDDSDDDLMKIVVKHTRELVDDIDKYKY